ncbi:MAG: ABC transporter ATP-binding protein [Candidatus Thermoplasmatota archaeon]|nr:ABC transporter ATP-binding protein [Candidatus Thermoplasmatota archaeon]
MPEIKVDSVFLSYETNSVLKGLSLHLKDGEKVSIIGANGAGKTTTLKIVAGILRPDSGSVSIEGISPEDERSKAITGYLPEDASPYGMLSVYENVYYAASLRGLDNARDRANAIMEEFGIRGYSAIAANKLSRGNRQRLSLAMTFVHSPKLLIMDEPLNYLDIPMQEKVIKMVRKADATVLVSTHVISTANSLTDRIAILNDGRITWEGTVDEVMSSASDGERLEQKIARMMEQ